MFRGTYGILSTCLLTMALCIWTAVHLNMGDGRSAWAQTGRKTGWLIIGLFAPELVAWTAFQQRKDAAELTGHFKLAFGSCGRKEPEGTLVRCLKRLFCCVPAREKADSEQKSETYELIEAEVGAHDTPPWKKPSRRHPWTTVHSQFALMGGFAIDLGSFDENFVPGKPERLVLTADGLKLLATIEPSLIPDVSREAIQDKSKASPLAKTIVCLQAFWFCIQCATRLAQDLSISLLELNTFAHALCAFLIYALWWNKPLDVDDPLLLQGEELESIVAAMVMLDMVSMGPKEFTYEFESVFRHTEGLGRARLTYSAQTTPCRDDTPLLVGDVIRDAAEADATPERDVTHKDFQLSEFSPFRQRGQKLERLQDVGLNRLTLLKKNHQLHGFRVLTKPIEPRNPRPDVSVWLTPRDVRWMKLASDYARRNTDTVARLVVVGQDQDDNKATTPHLVLRPKNWPPLGSWNSSGVHLHSKAILAGFTLAGLVYGMIHLSAWNAPFPSVSQMWLWRASAITLISSPLMLVIGLMGDYDANDDDFCSMFCSPFSFAFMVIGALCYVMARAFLVVECFIGLSHLPPEAFLVPHWSRYFPHIM
ncbi:hypothetical protein B0A55_08819 [Friedmanniomyces simplex]|uniref:Transmembrane protein n=1 Tax=Friedmanniomyces simplex TaxID=329884 RepID=A0A4V5NED3_9PEZI|nr:hypothetical protein B0A55_08819 [Friedmanniomyces simplex]